jgi:hypothetical protein
MRQNAMFILCRVNSVASPSITFMQSHNQRVIRTSFALSVRRGRNANLLYFLKGALCSCASIRTVSDFEC